VAIMQRGTTTTATSANVAASGSLACNKPTGVVSGDLMIAFLALNDDTSLGGPSGWTKQLDVVAGTPTVDHFECSLWYKVAGGSEGTTYSWTKSAGATASPMTVSISAWTGVNTNASPFGGTSSNFSNASPAEPFSVPSVTSFPLTLALYWRGIRVADATGTSAGASMSASGVTELCDFGIWSGGSVSYDQAQYVATSEKGSNAPALGITTTFTDTHDVVFGVTLIDANQPSSTVIGQAVKRASFY
jgi:hypothetical protein